MVDQELLRRWGLSESVWASHHLCRPKCNLEELTLEIMEHQDEVLYLYKCLEYLRIIWQEE